MLGQTIHELLGGNLNDGRNNILKSLQVVSVDDDSITCTAEPYDNAFQCNTEHQMDKTFRKLQRVLNRRKKAIFEAVQKDTMFVEVYDDMTFYSAITIRKDDAR
ncbi:hypothetical protein CVR97_28530 [Salmonella enterica subsp. enterica serovar Typhimurium]|uniref:hypothetical protein n=1 Tax=Salmonella enterica TaxID=28901 RepID=UPI000C22490B|nr:hypothetical protein [Salmonella enterica]PJH58672.1 hypothetical protein CVR97_28530 [Salmonella enterica subsp. enterica serovar Typhimurium]